MSGKTEEREVDQLGTDCPNWFVDVSSQYKKKRGAWVLLLLRKVYSAKQGGAVQCARQLWPTFCSVVS